MELSVIIVNFNTPELVYRCLDTLKLTSPKTKYEVIVIENGSEKKVHKAKLDNARLIENKKNLGFAKAVNQGIKKAKGKFVLLLNSDTKIKKGAVDKLMQFAKFTPDAGAVVPKLVNEDGTVQPSVYKLPKFTYAFCPKNLEKFVPKAEVVESAVMAAYLITPAALEKVGKLSEKYFLYYEDHDYNKRIMQAGLKVYYLPEAEVVHKHGASGGVNKQLIDSAKKYYGPLGYAIFAVILRVVQKWQRIFGKK